jgi:hypothetical protein
MRRELSVELIDPDGTHYDITERVALDGFGPVTEELESDLTELTHADLSLVLDDADGAMSAIFVGARRGAIYEVIVLRETAQRKPLWERVFGGIVSVPLGISRDTKERMIELHVYGYGKRAELVSAEQVRRSYTGTGSVGVGSKTITLSTSAPLARKDLITLNGPSADQQFTVASVDSATQVTAVESSTYSFVSVPVTLDTPYYRDKTIAELVDLLCDESGLPDRRVDVSQALATTPFASTPTTTGLPSTDPAGMLETNASRLAVYAGASIRRYEATSITSGFTDAGADTAKADWRPYLTTAPATLRDANGADDGSRAWDYDAGDYYDLRLSGTEDLELWKNGAFLVQVELGGTGGGAINEWVYALEFNEMLGQVWVSYHHTKETSGGVLTVNEQRTVRYSTAGTFLGLLVSKFGSLRCVRPLSRMAFLPWQLFSETVENNGTDGLWLYSGTTLDETKDATAGLRLWTLRAFGAHLACVTDYLTVAIWSQTSSDLAAEYEIAPTGSGSRMLATVFDVGGTSLPYYFGFAAGEYFVVSTAFSSVIPYADFDGKSCAAALRALAVVSGAYFSVDEYGIVAILGRDSLPIASQEPVPIDTPIEQVVQPVWEWLRTGVTVTGEDEYGRTVEVSAGSVGDSALTLTVSPDLPLTVGLAGALATAYEADLSVEREQLDEVIAEPDQLVRVLSRVTRDGRTYRVLRSEIDLENATQRVQLVEV